MPSLDPSLPEGTIVCLDCDYQLQGLTKHRCPECGRPFNADIAESFYTVTSAWDLRLKVAIGMVVGLTFIHVGLWSLAAAGVSAVFFVGIPLLAVAFVAEIFSLFSVLAYALDSRQPRGRKWGRVIFSLGVVLGVPVLGVSFLFDMVF